MNYFKVFMDIDAPLIERNTNRNTETDETDEAGRFREEQRGSIPENTGQETVSVRELAHKASVEKKLVDLKTAASKPSVPNPFLAMTDRLLESSWQNIFLSFGLTLIWIDIHVFLNKVFGSSAFRELGEEWIPEKIKKMGVAKTKQAAAMLRIIEGAGCGCLNLGCLFLIIAILSLLAMIVTVIKNPLGSLASIASEWFFGLFK